MPTPARTITRARAAAVLLATAGLGLGLAAPAAAAGTPTCSDVMPVEVHGQHIVADYVTGLGGDLSWPPNGGAVGHAVAGQGVVVAGGPGPGFHFPNGFAPGASFCNGSRSPGFHPGA